MKLINTKSLIKNLNSNYRNCTGVKSFNNVTKSIASFFAILSIDLFAISISLIAASCTRINLLQNLFPNIYRDRLLENTFSQIWWFPLVVIACLLYENLYQKRLPFWTEVEILLKASTLAVFLTIVWLYLAQVNEEISRTIIVLIWLYLIIFLPFFRYYGKLLIVRLGLWTKPVIICGSGIPAGLIIKAFNREKTMGYYIIGLLEEIRSERESDSSGNQNGINILGSTEDAEAIIRSTGVKDVIVAVSDLPNGQLVKLTNRLQQMTNNVLLVPDLFGLALNGIELNYFFEEQILLLQIKNRLKSLFNRLIKHIFDMVVGLVILITMFPLFLILALIIRIDSKGPVFYIAERIGQGGELFKCFKFRTMHKDALNILEQHLAVNGKARAEWLRYHKLTECDPRVTKVGNFLRRFSLDELPQLINVVKGEMSLVGPRPYLPTEKELMADWFDDITVTKPGITGLWQVSGRNNISFTGRLKLDSWYMKNWSPWLDLLLIVRTLKVVIKADGAY